MHSLLIEIMGLLRAVPKPHTEGLWMSHLNSVLLRDRWYKSGSGSLKRLLQAVQDCEGWAEVLCLDYEAEGGLVANDVAVTLQPWH